MPITLPASRCRGCTVERIELDDAVVLLLDDAGEYPLAIDGEGGEQQEGADVCDCGCGVRGLGIGRRERCRRQFRRRRQVVADRSHGRVRDCRELRVDVRAEDEPVGGEEEQRVDVLGGELLPPGGGRVEHS